jgi:hypothetical protein
MLWPVARRGVIPIGLHLQNPALQRLRESNDLDRSRKGVKPGYVNLFKERGPRKDTSRRFVKREMR